MTLSLFLPSSPKPLLAFSPLPLLLSGHSHLNLELPTLQAVLSPNASLGGPLNPTVIFCLPTTQNSLPSGQAPPPRFPCTPPFIVHCCVWNFAYIFSICLDRMKICCVYWLALFRSFLKSISKEPFIASSLYPDLMWFQSSPLDTEQVSTMISLFQPLPALLLSPLISRKTIYVNVCVY